MLLAKSCHAKDHITTRKTLRLGSLYEYQKTEQEQIADRHEGELTFKLKFDGVVTISKKWFNILFDGGVRFAGNEDEYSLPNHNFDIYIERLHTTGVTQDSVTIRDSSVVIAKQADNCFIFCMSNVQEKQDAIGIFPQYDAYWYIPELRKKQFGMYIGKILHDHVISEHAKGNYIIPKDTDIKNLQTGLAHQDVSYLPREIHITNQNIIELEDLIRRISLIFFTKPADPFSVEKEHRFCYIMTSNGRLIVPQQNSVILDAQYLMQFLV